MGLNVNFAMVPGPEGKQWIAWQITDGQITITLPPVHPDEMDDFADALSAGLKKAGEETRRANIGLIVPGQNVPIDPDLAAQLRNMASRTTGNGGQHNTPVQPPNTG